jgi:hypothetical protein
VIDANAASSRALGGLFDQIKRFVEPAQTRQDVTQERAAESGGSRPVSLHQPLNGRLSTGVPVHAPDLHPESLQKVPGLRSRPSDRLWAGFPSRGRAPTRNATSRTRPVANRTDSGVTGAISYGTTELCPVQALRRWREAAKFPAGAAFRRIFVPPARHQAGEPSPPPWSAPQRSIPAPWRGSNPAPRFVACAAMELTGGCAGEQPSVSGRY